VPLMNDRNKESPQRHRGTEKNIDLLALWTVATRRWENHPPRTPTEGNLLV
jgi:hypothetical protein